MNNLMQTALLGFFIGLIWAAHPAVGQEYVETFALKNSRDQVISLDNYMNEKAVVLAFTSEHCSWAAKYHDRLNELSEMYADKGIIFLAINSNDSTMSRLDAQSNMRVASPYEFDYLKDAEQTVAKLVKATRNPEVVLLVPMGKNFEVQYRGKIDDNPIDPAKVHHRYLKDAIDHVLVGEKPDPASTPVTGCNIRWIR